MSWNYFGALRREGKPGRAPVLLYHRLTSDESYEQLTGSERIYTIAESRFRAHMQALAEAGYRPISVATLLDHLRRQAPLPEKSLLISFDDGCASVAERALPILREFGFPGLLFVVTDPEAALFSSLPEEQRRVSDDQIRELEDGGIAIGSHSVGHRPLTGLPVTELDHELGDSKRVLEELLGEPVLTFGVPYGIYDDAVRTGAERADFEAVFTSEAGTAGPETDPYRIPRLNVSGMLDAPQLLEMLTPPAIARRELQRAVKRLPPRLLGAERWMRLRRRLRP